MVEGVFLGLGRASPVAARIPILFQSTKGLDEINEQIGAY